MMSPGWCAQCGCQLGDSPSDFFCSQRCQWVWSWMQSGCVDPSMVVRTSALEAQIEAIIWRRIDGPTSVPAC